ncbi:MAG: peroxiredoxin [Dehalococcoidia bacterium]
MEATGFRDAYEAATRLNAIVLGVSPDNVPTLRRFSESCRLPFPLASDAGSAIAHAYDVRRRFNLGTSRATYVIDKTGVIRAAFRSELSMASHSTRALAALEWLQP